MGTLSAKSGDLAERGKYSFKNPKLSYIIGHYNVAKLLNTTVGYLLGETEQTNLLSDPDMLKRLNDIANLPNTDKEHILYTIDNLLASVKTRLAYNS